MLFCLVGRGKLIVHNLLAPFPQLGEVVLDFPVGVRIGVKFALDLLEASSPLVVALPS